MPHHSDTKLLSPTILYEEARRRLREITACKAALEREIQKAPPGAIRIANSTTRVQFYFRKDRFQKTETYIRKRDTKTIRTYLRKAYDEKVLRILDEEIRNLDFLLKKSNELPSPTHRRKGFLLCRSAA